MKKEKIYWIRRVVMTVSVIVSLPLLLLFLAGCQPKWEIQNPYRQVDWNTHQRCKANLHTHTTRSDGRMNPHSVVDGYHQLGYDVLAITDHNEVTFPWTAFSEMDASSSSHRRLEEGQLEVEELRYENRNPGELNMLAIQGNELSKHHHMGSYFTDHNGTEEVEESLEATASKDGLVMFNHPGRYTNRDPGLYNVEWYAGYFQRYDHLLGLEIYNQGDRYPNDRQLWDAVLSEMMPERPVWGYSNDDMHHSSTLGRNWNVFLLPEISESWIRKGMREGRSFYVYAPSGHDGPPLPEIENIKVNKRKGLIELTCSGQDSVRWISDGKVVQRGSLFLLKENPGVSDYVRAEVFGPGETITGTQPFGITRH